MNKWQKMQDDIGEFCDKTFGQSTITSKLIHLREEIDEVEADPSDIIEWADCTILLLDGLRKAGYSTEDLHDAMLKKMEINRNRKWGEMDEDGVVRHVK